MCAPLTSSISKIMHKKIIVVQKQIETFIAPISPGQMSLYSNTSHAILYFVTTLHCIVNSEPFEGEKPKAEFVWKAVKCAYPGSGAKQKGKHAVS